MSCFDGAWRRQVADLIALVHASDLAELEIEHGSFALRIQRDAHTATVALAAAPPAAPPPPAAPTEPAVLRSPQVGTFYLSAEPHGEPFVREGSIVEPGQVIGLIEAMKLINEVEAEVGGVVRRVLVEDGQPVEYGQALFELE
jgi:acetyl-CoA carboxylase biotin carboxyl carrier protein